MTFSSKRWQEIDVSLSGAVFLYLLNVLPGYSQQHRALQSQGFLFPVDRLNTHPFSEIHAKNRPDLAPGISTGPQAAVGACCDLYRLSQHNPERTPACLEILCLTAANIVIQNVRYYSTDSGINT
jgi:hypothetical protein